MIFFDIFLSFFKISSFLKRITVNPRFSGSAVLLRNALARAMISGLAPKKNAFSTDLPKYAI